MAWEVQLPDSYFQLSRAVGQSLMFIPERCPPLQYPLREMTVPDSTESILKKTPYKGHNNLTGSIMCAFDDPFHHRKSSLIWTEFDLTEWVS